MDQLFYKTLGDRRENRDLYGHGAGGHGPFVAGKAGRCLECAESRLCESGPYEMVPWL